jgi:hypothetical protein
MIRAANAEGNSGVVENSSKELAKGACFLGCFPF